MSIETKLLSLMKLNFDNYTANLNDKFNTNVRYRTTDDRRSKQTKSFLFIQIHFVRT